MLAAAQRKYAREMLNTVSALWNAAAQTPKSQREIQKTLKHFEKLAQS
jgi:hypothetical protein